MANVTYSSDHEILVSNADGTGSPVQLTDTPSVDESFPTWSPDGTKMVFGLYAGCETCDSEIWVSNADGTGGTKIGLGAWPDWQALPLSVSVSSHDVQYGATVTVTAHLYWFSTSTNQTVSIYRRPYGESPKLVMTGTLNSGGDLTAQVTLGSNTQLFATWTGDADHAALTSPSQLVGVHVRTTGHLSKNYATSGQYRLYHVGTKIPYTGKVVPNHAGDPLFFVLERYKSGAWKVVGSAKIKLRSDSTALVYAVGYPKGSYREGCYFKGDNDHLGNSSVSSYFKITS